ncbi:UNVERIFIED_CONTAM: hypothetical protein FKN15_032425 [Acipenser sinensis]
MNFFLETLQVIFLSTYYLLEAFVKLFIPARRKNVTGEIVLITGAGSGIGRLMAVEFSKLGVTLVLWDINQEGSKETARLAKEQGASRVHCYVCDCSNKTEVYRVADQCRVTSSVIDKPRTGTPKKLSNKDEQYLKIISLRNRKKTSVELAEGTGVAVRQINNYCASKFAAVGFAESVGLEMLASGKDGIKTTIVCPYFINTGMFDGCYTKWPRLLPILDPNYAAEKIVDAILKEEVYLVMPRSLNLIFAMKKWPRLLPILDPNYAADKIVDAILKEEVYLVMPRSLNLIFAMKN